MHFFPWMRPGHCSVQASPGGERYPASPSQQAKLCRGLGGLRHGPPCRENPSRRFCAKPEAGSCQPRPCVPLPEGWQGSQVVLKCCRGSAQPDEHVHKARPPLRGIC